MNYKEFTKESYKRNAKYLLLINFVFMFILIATVMNFQAVRNNDCRMPFQSSIESESDTHFSFQDKEEVSLYFFTDIIKLKVGKYLLFFSIGDTIYSTCAILMIIIAIFVIRNDIKLYKEFKKNNPGKIAGGLIPSQ